MSKMVEYLEVIALLVGLYGLAMCKITARPTPKSVRKY
jgi:hypothetical protein